MPQELQNNSSQSGIFTSPSRFDGSAAVTAAALKMHYHSHVFQFQVGSISKNCDSINF
jgi:hypothetical protein